MTPGAEFDSRTGREVHAASRAVDGRAIDGRAIGARASRVDREDDQFAHQMTDSTVLPGAVGSDFVL